MFGGCCGLTSTCAYHGEEELQFSHTVLADAAMVVETGSSGLTDDVRRCEEVIVFGEGTEQTPATDDFTMQARANCHMSILAVHWVATKIDHHA